MIRAIVFFLVVVHLKYFFVVNDQPDTFLSLSVSTRRRKNSQKLRDFYFLSRYKYLFFAEYFLSFLPQKIF